MRVADYLVSRLSAEGIDTIFGLTGGGIMHLIDAITLSKNMRWQSVHHEEFAGVCADGYARSGKRFGVAFATTGPGTTNLFTSVAAAWQDSVPILLFVGQVKTTDSSRLIGSKIRQNGTFEFDSIGPYSCITKKATLVKDAEEAILAIEEGITLCQDLRPGPVIVEIPLDVQAMIVKTNPRELNKAAELTSRVNNHEVSKFKSSLRSALARAKRPIFVFGNGVVRSKSETLVGSVYEIGQIPYVVTQFARQVGVFEHEGYLGSPGVKANRSANMGMSEADLIVLVGTSLHQQVIGWNGEAFKQLPSHKIWTEIDPETRMLRKHLVDEVFDIDSTNALNILRDVLEDCEASPTGIDRWQVRARELRKKYLLHYPIQQQESDRFSLYKAISTLSRRANEFQAVTTDAGIVWYVVPQHFFPARGTHFISSGSFGAMGMALPLAIGSASATKRKTLCITGDGSLMTCLQELATLASSQLPILLVVNSNQGYLSIKTTHNKFFSGRKLGTDSSNGVFIPSIRDLAALFGIVFHQVSTEQSLEAILGLDSIVNLEKPTIIEIRTFINQLVEPVIISKLNNETGLMESGSLTDLDPPVDRRPTSHD